VCYVNVTQRITPNGELPRSSFPKRQEMFELWRVFDNSTKC
jgi:hypothetical protein